ncbi:hypothetical protein FB567DRAFT_525095 [Paraphoma chrysanthemicola]|uniref:Uncharacterized protein n=1 Tax=Paraphoma chrysanthemicola TaxID=798071 RepID=A0A8K0R8D1_9PLEO|nr:hypothetical protein FB567DRAFT_525095 [Paraphoma chrysanthemicola]
MHCVELIPGTTRITTRLLSWPSTFIPQGVLGWIDELKDGLRSPMDPAVLALVQCICLYTAVKQGVAMKLPTPAQDHLLAALKLVGKLQKPASTPTTNSPIREDRASETSSSEDETDDDGSQLDPGDIIQPKHRITGNRRLTRAQMRGEPACNVPDYVGKLKITPTPHKESIPRKNIAPAGPAAMKSLQKNMLPSLLAKLPQLSELSFRNHSKDAFFARLCLKIGVYGSESVDIQGNDVLTYMKPKETGGVGPALLMQVQRRVPGHRFELQEVTWNNDIKLGLIKLEPFAQEVRSYEEIYAVIKYCFLLATEAMLGGYKHHFIPINNTFVHHLTALYKRSGSAPSNVEDGGGDHMDEDRSSPPVSAKGLSHRGIARPKRCLNKPRPVPMSDFIEFDGDEQDCDSDYGSDVPLPEPNTKQAKTPPNVPGFNIMDENTDMEQNNRRPGYSGKRRSYAQDPAGSSKKRPLAMATTAAVNSRNGAKAHQVRSSVALRKESSTSGSAFSSADMMDIDW